MKTLKAIMTALLLPGLLWAGAVPPTITYQGTIKQQGVPVNGTLPMSFRLTNSDGTQVFWSGAVTPSPSIRACSPAFFRPREWTGRRRAYIEMSVNGQTFCPVSHWERELMPS